MRDLAILAGNAQDGVGSLQRLLLAQWEGRPGGFSKGYSESWSLQPGASARVSKAGRLLATGAGAGTVWNWDSLINVWEAGGAESTLVSTIPQHP